MQLRVVAAPYVVCQVAPQTGPPASTHRRRQTNQTVVRRVGVVGVVVVVVVVVAVAVDAVEVDRRAIVIVDQETGNY